MLDPGDLSPSAARFVLALITARQGEDMQDIALRAGIGTYRTYVKAKQELLDKKIISYQDVHVTTTLNPFFEK
jgi:hypothetical protein